MFDFYNLCYKKEYLNIEDLKRATAVEVITQEEYKNITGLDFI